MGLQEALLDFNQRTLSNPFFMHLTRLGQPYLLAIRAPGALGVPGHLAEEPQEPVQRVAVARGQQEEQQLKSSQLRRTLHG